MPATTKQKYFDFLEGFCESRLGIVGNERSTNGAAIFATRLDDGRRMIPAFADTPVFIHRFGRNFNGWMRGAEILEVVLHDPACDGALVYSAKVTLAVAIDRYHARLGLTRYRRRHRRGGRPWSRFW